MIRRLRPDAVAPVADDPVGRRTHELATLHRLGSGLARSLDAGEVLERALGALIEMGWYTCGEAYALDRSRDTPVAVGSCPYDEVGTCPLRPALLEAIEDAVTRRAVPFFGICVGMQLLATTGEEFAETAGLGWVPGRVTRIDPDAPGLKVPHMGWNDLRLDRAHPVLEGVATGDHAYFVHSYRFEAADPAHVLAHADYGGPVTAIVGRDNIVGTQFHPEKSQSAGLRMIANFLRWRP